MNQFFDIAQSAVNGVTPFHALTGVGLGFSSFLFLSQLGGARFGVAPMVCDAGVRQSLSIPIELAVRQWNFFFARASPPVVLGVAGGSIAYLTASYFVTVDRHGAKADALRNWLRLAAVVAFLPLPYTVRALGPVNAMLVKLARNTSTSFTPADATQASTLLATWVHRHAFRIGLYGLSVVVGVVPLLASAAASK